MDAKNKKITLRKSDTKLYSNYLRQGADNADSMLRGIFEVLESNALNGSSILLKSDSFRQHLTKLLSYITDLTVGGIPLGKAKKKIKMCLADNRRIVQVVDQAFEPVSGDATAIALKKTYLIVPAMRLRKCLHEAMCIIEKGESNVSKEKH